VPLSSSVALHLEAIKASGEVAWELDLLQRLGQQVRNVDVASAFERFGRKTSTAEVGRRPPAGYSDRLSAARSRRTPFVLDKIQLSKPPWNQAEIAKSAAAADPLQRCSGWIFHG
jgi:hypothetical protein